VDVGTPPPEAASTPLPTDASLVTNRQKTEVLTSRPECAACHEPFINPLGFALESFDAVGQTQSVDNGEPIDTTATVIVYPDSIPVTGAAELMQALANSPRPRLCYAQKWIQYAFHSEAGEHSCLTEKLALVLEQGSIVDMVRETTGSEWFLEIVSESPGVPEPDATNDATNEDSPAPEPVMDTPVGAAGSGTEAAGGASGQTQETPTGGSSIEDPSAGGGKKPARVARDAGTDSHSETKARRAPADDAGVAAEGDSRRRGVNATANESGCGCRTVGNGSLPRGNYWPWLGLGLALQRRRRVLGTVAPVIT
jgi:MYXO-CTERM domain-containing protein